MSVLHVTNGESTAQSLRDSRLATRDSRIGGEVLAWNDVLHEGPRPSGTQAKFRGARARFLGECGWVESEARRMFEVRDAALARALTERRAVVLWFEHDLYDQLQLVQILDRVEDPAPVETIFVDSYEGHPNFRGLGELDPDELETLWPRRIPLTAAEVALGRRAWAALVAGDQAIEQLLGEDTSALPFLASALHRLLEERPDPVTGLSRSERQLLEELDDGPAAPGQLFRAVQEREDAPFDGDAWVRRRIGLLAAGGLVATAEGRVELTDAGRAVLAGRAGFARPDAI